MFSIGLPQADLIMLMIETYIGIILEFRILTQTLPNVALTQPALSDTIYILLRIFYVNMIV